MKIKCLTNLASSLPKDILENYTVGDKTFPVIERKEYVAYAVGTFLDYIWYCICDEDYLFYPMWTPSTLFEVTDNRLSRYWVLSFVEEKNKNTLRLSFPEWANDPYFYGELVDGNGNDPNAIIFRQYKELMDLEFPDSSVLETAQIGDEEWLICPDCIDAWQSKDNQDALVRCPKCWEVYNNPRYKSEWPHLPTDQNGHY